MIGNKFMLKSIAIRNLRGIKECVVKDLSDVNILIGRNGAGKSTILEAIYLASAWVAPEDELHDVLKVNYVISRRAGRGGWSESRDILWYTLNTDRDIEIDLSFSSGKIMRFRIRNYISYEEAIWLDISNVLQRGEYNYYSYVKNKLLNPKTHAWVTASSETMDNVVSIFRKEIDFLRRTMLIDSLTLTQPELVERRIWPKLLAKRLDKRIISMIKEGFEAEAEDLTYMPMAGTYVLALKLSKTTVRVDDLGDGARAAILLASILSVTRNTVVLVEDPEVHQHPGGLVSVMDFVLRMAKENDVQLVMSTHSIELINIVRRLCDKYGLGLKIFFLERGVDGVVDVRTLESVDVDVLTKLGLDPRFLYTI